jgi:hypothetical protein
MPALLGRWGRQGDAVSGGPCADGDQWHRQMSGLKELEVGIAPSFTKRMTYDESAADRVTPRPVRGVTERPRAVRAAMHRVIDQMVERFSEILLAYLGLRKSPDAAGGYRAWLSSVRSASSSSIERESCITRRLACH